MYTLQNKTRGQNGLYTFDNFILVNELTNGLIEFEVDSNQGQSIKNGPDYLSLSLDNETEKVFGFTAIPVESTITIFGNAIIYKVSVTLGLLVIALINLIWMAMDDHWAKVIYVEKLIK